MSDENKMILVAQIGGAFGVKGEVRITAFTADPMALMAYQPLLKADGTPALTLLSARPDKAGVVARVKEIATKEQADALRGLKLFVPRDQLPEPDEDEFYLTDLVGLEARDASGAVVQLQVYVLLENRAPRRPGGRRGFGQRGGQVGGGELRLA